MHPRKSLVTTGPKEEVHSSAQVEDRLLGGSPQHKNHLLSSLHSILLFPRQMMITLGTSTMLRFNRAFCHALDDFSPMVDPREH